MHDTRRQFIEAILALPALPLLTKAQESEAAIKPVVLRGRVVNLADVMQQKYQATLVPERAVLYCLKTAEGKFYTFLPTDLAAAIYDDERFRQRELQVTARTFADFPFIEIIKLQSVKWGRVFDLYYFCNVCNIKIHKPGPCECCQDPVVFTEEPVKDQ
ncbi:MAG TPA: hypothetical protein VFZ34_14180 [Blastocatellia bacterium]|nr:hypothetical protein [Blastocatellia bacterium]